MSEQKLCIDCKWVRKDSLGLYRCGVAVKQPADYLVTGKVKDDGLWLCKVTRLMEDECGTAGHWFEPLIPKPSLVARIKTFINSRMDWKEKPYDPS